ncbi:Hypothetical predicted protein [Lecanosticta acicola]|uniref:DUF7907 domain-containing protein n=1 Tax=Lecanosticta acicola TaxID=111012 RepID=A0AAI8YVX1_9PEZI|nr:Hypothetical predicted protein [Lecanosticta acicola]
MKLFALLLGGAAVALAALNSTQEYRLKTCLKPGQAGKEQYDNLWLVSYHTGAGLSDATFMSAANKSSAIRGYLGPTNVTSSNGTKYYNQLFDLNNTFPFGLAMEENTNFYAGWEPVRLNADVGSSFETNGFFINGTGLQWTSNTAQAGSSSDAFGGWLVCDWWHGAPQLFFRIRYYARYGFKTPSSCADVYLQPVYF